VSQHRASYWQICQSIFKIQLTCYSLKENANVKVRFPLPMPSCRCTWLSRLAQRFRRVCLQKKTQTTRDGLGFVAVQEFRDSCLPTRGVRNRGASMRCSEKSTRAARYASLLRGNVCDQ
jgi:hypothetical protein